MTPSLEGWSTNVKEAPSPHEMRLTQLETNPTTKTPPITKTQNMLKQSIDAIALHNGTF